MSVYDPYYGRYSGYGGYGGYGAYNMYRAPSTRSYYSSYGASSPYSAYSAYTDPSTDWYSRSMTGGTVSQRIYFSLNGKLIRSYKIRNYRVRRSNLARGRLLGIDFSPTYNPESPETCFEVVSGPAAGRRLFSHPILCYASWAFPWTIRRLQSLHIEAHVGNRSGQSG